MVREIDGRGFAFVPREMVWQPKAFGIATGPLKPAHGVDAAGERYRAAMLQHIMAVTVRDELAKAEGIAPTVFVARFQGRGLGADRVRRIFRGETMAQLTDLMFWMSHLPAVAAAVAEFIDAPAGTGFEISTAAAAAELTPEGLVETEAGPDGAARARQNALMWQQEADRISRAATTVRQEQEARRTGAAAPETRRTPQSPFETSPGRMR